jgi:hypothetical protein
MWWACRSRSKGIRLLDLPAELLMLIISKLGTRSLAAARLTCRSLSNDATVRKRQEIDIHVGRLHVAKARARVLELMQSYGHCLATASDQTRDDEKMSEVNSTLSNAMARVLQDVVCVEMFPLEEVYGTMCFFRYLSLADEGVLKPIDSRFATIFNPRILMSHMRQLRSVNVNTSVTVQDILQLQTFSQLTCVEMKFSPCESALQLMCSMLALPRVDLGNDLHTLHTWVTDAANSNSIVQALAHSRLGASLHDLSLPCHAAAVGGLATLTGLTALHIRTWPCDSFAGLTCLTHLLSLRILFQSCWPEKREAFCWEAFSSLTALTRLTALCLNDALSSSFPFHVENT